MALVTKLERKDLDHQKIHTKASCTYTTFTADDGKIYLQIDTYGSETRKMTSKKSQTIQIDADTIHTLLREISDEFDLNIR